MITQSASKILKALDEFCRRWKVSELSAQSLGEHAHEGDCGLFVRFDPSAEWSLTDRIVMQQELQNISGHVVNLRSRHGANLRNGRMKSMRLIYNA
jgi:hypothetical protein